jgi:uncharacterized membrane protein
MLCGSASGEGSLTGRNGPAHVMTIKDLLQGKWLGHPLHPALVHVPTGLWPAALVFDLISFFGPGSAGLVRASFWCVCGGLLVALAAIPAGLADWWDIKPGKPARKLGWWHMGLNAIVFGLFFAGFCTRIAHGLSAVHVDPASLLLCLVGDAILFVSGYLGGRMVYAHGTGVGRMSKQKWRKIAQDSGAHVPAAES